MVTSSKQHMVISGEQIHRSLTAKCEHSVINSLCYTQKAFPFFLSMPKNHPVIVKSQKSGSKPRWRAWPPTAEQTHSHTRSFSSEVPLKGYKDISVVTADRAPAEMLHWMRGMSYPHSRSDLLYLLHMPEKVTTNTQWSEVNEAIFVWEIKRAFNTFFKWKRRFTI